jgi:hypothetical protein
MSVHFVNMLVLFTTMVIVTESVKICGNYCGPDWCASTVIDETACVKQKIWGSSSDGSCIDSCCRLHDYCCGAGNRASCNSALAKCASSCHGPCADAVWAYMKFHSDFCCGTNCPTSMIKTLETLLNKTISRDMLAE